ncbi:MAG: hypothetical protein ACK450_06140, partial [Sphingomonadales bacterium]
MRMSKLAGLLLSAATLSVSLSVPVSANGGDAGQGAEAKDAIVVNGLRGRAETAVFGKRPFMRSPRLSPDGTKIAVMMSRNGVDNLGWIDLNKPGSAPTFFLAAEEQREVGDRSVASWRWVGNRTIVYTLTSRENI